MVKNNEEFSVSDSEGGSNSSFLDGSWSCTAAYKFCFQSVYFKYGVGGRREAEMVKILMHS